MYTQIWILNMPFLFWLRVRCEKWLKFWHEDIIQQRDAHIRQRWDFSKNIENNFTHIKIIFKQSQSHQQCN